MEQMEHIASVIALTMGVSWASGINLYAALMVLGISGATGSVDLPLDLQILENPLVIGAAGIMYAIEFVADKIPGVDTAWDSVHTFVRIPAGAMLAAASIGGDGGLAMEVAAAILGAGVATTSHVTKAGSRVVINASPEPFTNWGASVTEDVAVFGGLWAALHQPWLFLGLFVAFIIFLAWLWPKIWRAMKSIVRGIGRLIGLKQPEPPVAADEDADKYDQLARLKTLLDSGALTAAEFDAEKAKILASDDTGGDTQ